MLRCVTPSLLPTVVLHMVTYPSRLKYTARMSNRKQRIGSGHHSLRDLSIVDLDDLDPEALPDGPPSPTVPKRNREERERW